MFYTLFLQKKYFFPAKQAVHFLRMSPGHQFSSIGHKMLVNWAIRLPNIFLSLSIVFKGKNWAKGVYFTKLAILIFDVPGTCYITDFTRMPLIFTDRAGAGEHLWHSSSSHVRLSAEVQMEVRLVVELKRVDSFQLNHLISWLSTLNDQVLVYVLWELFKTLWHDCRGWTDACVKEPELPTEQPTLSRRLRMAFSRTCPPLQMLLLLSTTADVIVIILLIVIKGCR